MRQRAKLFTALFALFLTATPFLKAQDNSSMTGVVTDVTGAVVPGTTVQLVNTSRGITFTVKSDNDGSYRFPNVPPAPGYAATFSHDGFSTFTIDNITLTVAVTRTQNAKLTAGANQRVEVSATNAVVTLNTTDASVGNSFDIELLNDLPVQNRNTPAALFTLQPGVTNSGSVTGARTDQTSITVDGMDVNDISTGGFGTIVGNIPVDAVQEFRGTVAGLTNNLGTGSGGQFQLVSKSGTNKFHGNLNEYHRDTSTAANTWFLNNSATPRTPLIRNQFGGNIGGPVIIPKVFNGKDKLYFFADFYNSRIVQSLTGTDTVPLDSYRAGNISYVKTGCSPTLSRQNSNPACIGMYTPAQVKALDPAGIGETPTLFDPINGLFATRYPHANDLTGGDGVNTGTLRFTQGTLNLEYDGLARVDYNITPKQRVFVQFHAAHRDSIQSVNYFPNDPITRPFQDRSYGFVGSHIWQIGNNKVNQAYFGETVQVASFPLSYNPDGATIFNIGTFTNPYDGGNIQRRRIPIPEVRDDFNWQVGRHSLSAGGTYKFIKTENFLGSDYNSYNIGLGGNVSSLNPTLRPGDIQNTGTTNTTQWDNVFADALGRVGSISSIYNYTASGAVLPSGTGANRRYRYYQTEVYVGDTWKVNKELTFSYGVRYQNYSVPYETLGAEAVPSINNFNDYFAARLAQSKAGQSGPSSVPLISYSLGGKVNNAPGYYKPNNLDFAPRLSFAYNPSYSPKTVISGSGNVVYDRTVYNAISFQQNQSTFIFQNSAATNYGNSANANTSLATDPRIGATILSLPSPPVAPALSKPYFPYVTAAGVPNGQTQGLSTTGFDYNLPTPYSIAFNAGIQQELPGRFIMKINYAGRLGRRLLAQADASQVIDYPDTQSGQMMSQAFANLETQVRAGVANASVTPQPWFEHIIIPGYGASHGYANNTALVATAYNSNVKLGNIPGILRQLSPSSGLLIPNNVGLGAQFARTIYYTSKGSSNYNGLLFTVSKNLAQGVKFDFNYTWSHSIDNVSLIANSNGLYLYDATNLRAGRANSDFDVQNIISSDFLVQLPFGHGRQFASHVPWYVDEAIGGWSVSGLPGYQSGLAFSPASGAVLAGVSTSDPAIFIGNRGDLKAHVHKDTSTGQLVLYDNRTNVYNNDFRGPIGIEYGNRNMLRGPSVFTMDAGLSKSFAVLPDNRANLIFRADFYNVLNHPIFATPAASLANASTFGVITANASQYTNRVGQFALRLEF